MNQDAATGTPPTPDASGPPAMDASGTPAMDAAPPPESGNGHGANQGSSSGSCAMGTPRPPNPYSAMGLGLFALLATWRRKAKRSAAASTFSR